MDEFEQIGFTEQLIEISLLDKLKEFVNEACFKLGLDRKFVRINPLKSKNSYSVWICEPPDWFFENYQLKETYRIISISEVENRKSHHYEIIKNGDTTIFEIGDETNMYDYIAKTIDYDIENYRTSYNFGCCSSFEKCSDNKKCLHKDNLYARACSYRKNLENGRIFYGINRNI